MLSVIASSAVDCEFESRSVKPRTIKFVFVASPLSTRQCGERTKIGWLGIRIMRQRSATCLSTDCCFSELAL